MKTERIGKTATTPLIQSVRGSSRFRGAEWGEVAVICSPLEHGTSTPIDSGIAAEAAQLGDTQSSEHVLARAFQRRSATARTERLRERGQIGIDSERRVARLHRHRVVARCIGSEEINFSLPTDTAGATTLRIDSLLTD